MKETTPTFNISTYNPSRDYPKHTVFALAKGNHAGKPAWEPWANSFAIVTKSESDKELIYWSLYILWKSKEVYRHLIGSVVPFVRIHELGYLLQQTINKLKSKPNHTETIAKVVKLQKIGLLAEVHLNATKVAQEAFMKQLLR